MLRVIHIITKLELGGAQQNTLYTLRHLDPRLFSGMLVTHPEGLLAEEARHCDRYDTHFVPSLLREVRPLADLRALAALTGLLRREVAAASAGTPPRTVLVHTHSSKAGILGRAAARMAGVPIVVHSIHGYGFHPYQTPAVRSFYVTMEKLVSRWTTHFVAVSRANIEEGLALGLFPPEKVTLIRSGIDIARFRGDGVDAAAVRRSLPVAPGSRLVGMVACLKPQKNPVDFVRLAAIVAAQVPGTEFIIAGDGVLRPKVEAAMEAHGLRGRLHLLGWRDDIPRIMAALDVLVLTSLWEGLPRVFPQAMAAGRPVVAYGVDGGPEAVVEGVNGHLVPPGDYRLAAARVVDLLRHPDRAAAFGRAGAERVGEFDADLMVRQQEELYGRLLAMTSSRPRLAGT